MRRYKLTFEDQLPKTIKADYVEFEDGGVLSFYKTTDEIGENDRLIGAYSKWLKVSESPTES